MDITACNSRMNLLKTGNLNENSNRYIDDITGFKGILKDHQRSMLYEMKQIESNQIEYNHNEGFWQGCVVSTVEFIDTHIVPHITD